MYFGCVFKIWGFGFFASPPPSHSLRMYACQCIYEPEYFDFTNTAVPKHNSDLYYLTVSHLF